MAVLFRYVRCLGLCSGLLLLGLLRSEAQSQTPDPSDTTYVRFNTSLGSIDVQLLTKEAPLNTANFMSYVNNGSYNNVIINRSVPGFIFQAGEYTLVTSSSGDGFGSNTPGNPVNSEASLPGAFSNTRGTISFALSSGDSNSGTNQWFFNEVDNNSDTSPANLDSQGFTVFGVVANSSSLAVMDTIANVPVFLPPNDNPFISPADYASDTNPAGPSPDDFAFGRIPLFDYTLGNDAAPNTVFVSNLVMVNSITTLTTTTFTTWQAAFQSDPNATTDSLPAATPQNDGTTNLLKYLCDIPADSSMSATNRAKLPTVSQTTISGTTYMTLTWHQRPNLVGVYATAETSTDLHTWAAPTNATTNQTTATDGSGDVIMQVQVPAPATGAQFIRLSLTQ